MRDVQITRARIMRAKIGKLEAENERLREINAELLEALEDVATCHFGDIDCRLTIDDIEPEVGAKVLDAMAKKVAS